MYDYSYSYSSGDAEASIAVLGSMLIISLVIGLIFYIFESVGLYTLAKRRGIHNPGLAWVPVARDWVMGSLSDQYALRLGQHKGYRRILPILGAVVTILAVLILSFSLQFVVRLASGDPVLYAQLYQASNNPEEAVLLIFGSVVPFVSILYIVGIVYMVFYFITLYKLFQSCRPGSAVGYLLLSIFLGFLRPFLIFACRNSDEGYMMPAYYPPYGTYPPQGGAPYNPQGGYYNPPQGGAPYNPQGGYYNPPQGGAPYTPPQGGYYNPPQGGAPYTPPQGGYYNPSQNGASYTPPQGGYYNPPQAGTPYTPPQNNGDAAPKDPYHDSYNEPKE